MVESMGICVLFLFTPLLSPMYLVLTPASRNKVGLEQSHSNANQILHVFCQIICDMQHGEMGPCNFRRIKQK